MLMKYHRPTRIDKAEYTTLWNADLESGSEIWCQISHNQEEPNWTRLGDVYEQFFKIDECNDDDDSKIEDLMYFLESIADHKKEDISKNGN